MTRLIARPASLIQLILSLFLATSAGAGTATVAGTAAATAPSSTWIAFEVPFTGDDDRDGWTLVELGLAAGGPFDLVSPRRLPGSPDWRGDNLGGLTPDTDYYLRLTFVDPDGVSGTSPQVVGPVHTLASAADAVTLGTATAEVRETEIFVSLPIADDANHNSYGIVEIATGPGGPWTRRCGNPSGQYLPFHPKRCRLRSLTPGTDYWLRVDLTDPDGIAGTDPQVLGPITYTGLENVAAGRPITADPGWGCCPNPAQLVDGRIQYDFWPFGFAWTGGTSGYGGGPAGWKQATLDLGPATAFDRLVFWAHDGSSPPIDWKVETSDDGASWSEVYSTTEPMCRGVSDRTDVHWSYPSCGQEARFPEVTARYVRYSFDDRTLFGGLHGWAVELEVFAPDTTMPGDPTAVAGTSHTPSAWSDLPQITVEWSGASDAGGSGLAGYSVLFDTSPSTLPDETIDVAHSADPHSTTSSPLADGQEHYFHLRACDGAGNCTATVHLGPFWIDGTPPAGPTAVISPSHAPGVPSGLDSVTMTWTPATDVVSGVDGYAYQFVASPGPACDQGKDLEETATAVASPALGDGSWWFHVCAVDNAGNWGATVTAGPYVIDTLPPSGPTALGSSSHTPGTASNLAQVTMTWTPASDVVSGVDGYAYQFAASPGPACDQVKDLEEAATGITSPTLADGSWWFHVCAVDNAGNWGATVTAGPYVIDTLPPSGPTALGSSSHTPGTASNLAQVTMTWTPASDVVSGVDGYAYQFAASPGPACDQVKDLEEAATGVTSPTLADGDWWFHVCAVDNAGNWGATVTAGPYVIDTLPPSGPTALGSSSHTPGTASNLAQVTMTWTPASDVVSGVDGYAYQFAASPGPACDQVKDLEEAATGVTSPTLADGDWWFHVCAVDNAGNWGATVTAGPYVIDTLPPSGPTALGSSSHTPGTASNLAQVTMTWTPASDVVSGVDGYAYQFADSPGPACDQVKDLEEAATGVTSPTLADGDWWFHVCAVDNAGNWGATVTAGPYVIDTLPPSGPTALGSSSHTPGTASNLAQVTMTWTPASDVVSGVDGYAYQFADSPGPACDQVKDLEEAATGVTSPTLADGDWWFHVCAVDNAGNWGATVTAGPYVIDTLPPSDPPVVQSTTHATSTWSDSNGITVQWSGAVDAGGAGLAGYSVLFDSDPSGLPDAAIEVAHTTDPHATTSQTLADGTDHWFHLRSCDAASNCTATVHLGPFWIDATAPGAPTDLLSTSHSPGVPSSDPTIDLEWTAAVDVSSGIDGYGYEFSTSVWTCDEVKDLEEITTTASSSELVSGVWYGHVCALDNSGNWSPVATAGPFLVDSGGLLFFDGFESGDTGAWSWSVPPLALVLIDTAGVEFFHGAWLLDAAILPTAALRFTLVEGLDADGRPIFAIEAQCKGGAIALRARLPSGGGRWLETRWQPIPSTVHELEVDWRRALPGLRDGQLQISIDGELVHWLVDLDNSRHRLAWLRRVAFLDRGASHR